MSLLPRKTRYSTHCDFCKDIDFEQPQVVVREGKGIRPPDDAARQPGGVSESPDGLSTDPRSGIARRHHLDPSGLQRAVKTAAKLVRINKPVSPHTFRPWFATQLLDAGDDTRKVQELLGHKDVKTIMVYTHLLHRRPKAVRNPLDA